MADEEIISVPSIVAPKQPEGAGWERATWWRCPPKLSALDYPVQAWAHRAAGLFVLSAVEVAEDPGQSSLGPEYHLSVSRFGKRVSSAKALWALEQFGLRDAREDNHVPGGVARNFWRPVADNLSGYKCPCVDDEPAIVEDKGDFVWRGVTR